MKTKLLIILGPTASGKSDLAVQLAKKYNGEIISADSRQVYKGLNICTGKITKKEMSGIKHHLLDVTDPKKVFTVSQFKTLVEIAIADISSRGKLPIICGGTGFYIQAVVDNIILPEVPPNKKLREKLNKKTTTELFEILKKLDNERAKNIDAKNPRRLIRAIEIAEKLGKVPPLNLPRPLLENTQGKVSSNLMDRYSPIFIGIKTDPQILKEKIHNRLLKRLKNGMLSEAKKLHSKGLSWKRMEDLGLEYRYMARFLQKKITKEEMIVQLEKEIWQYAKRQGTWWKKDGRVKWINLEETINLNLKN